jgi:ATP-dependent DNA ligase
MILPKLYKRTSGGSTQEWLISVNKHDDGYSIDTEYGLIDGAKQYSQVVITKGKNVGKKNETTVKEQAESEALSKWNKQKDKGYSESSDEITLAEKMNKKPMKANDFGSCKIQYPCYMQPKLDGNRCIAAKENGVIALTSRGNKPIKGAEHIAAELKDLLSDGDIIDGELYIHNTSLEKLNSLIKKKQADSKKLKYCVYDCITPGPYSVRQQRLQTLFPANYKTIELVKTVVVNNEAEVMEVFREFRNEGYEGGMIRHGPDEYKAGYRSNSLLKVKEWKDDEFEIVDVVEGEGKFKGLGIIELVTKEGYRFKATPLGDESRRREYFNNRKNYIGKFGTVEYFEYTNTDKPVPKMANFKCIRD